MGKKLVKDFSASTLQIILNQLCGLIIFYILSKYLFKEDFGELNWSIATISVLIALTGFGMELIVVKRIAAGGNVKEIAGLHLIHSFVSAIFFFIILLSVFFFNAKLNTSHSVFTGISLSLILSFLASPFKQIANGRRQFHLLMFMSTISNLIRAVLLSVLLLTSEIRLQNVVLVFIISSLAELTLSGYLIVRQTSLFPLIWSKKKYFGLVKESLPQFGVVLFNSALARFDWIILGIVTTTIITADYVFAYKVFELSRLPLLIISPVLVPIFAKLFSAEEMIRQKAIIKLKLLFSIEMFISVLIPIVLGIAWTPLMDYITSHKYGALNKNLFLVLSICVPLQFATDYYWNVCFAQGQLKLTMKVSIFSSLLNILLNIIFIPVFGAIAAAWSYVSCYVLQIILFKKYAHQEKIKPAVMLLIKTLLNSTAAMLICMLFIKNIYLSVSAALILYTIFSIITGTLVPKKVKLAINVFLK